MIYWDFLDIKFLIVYVGEIFYIFKNIKIVM